MRQRHGLLSLALVARKGGKPDPSFEAAGNGRAVSSELKALEGLR